MDHNPLYCIEESVAVVECYVAHGSNCCAINRTPSYRMIPHGTRLFTEKQIIQAVDSFKSELREKGTIVEADLQIKIDQLKEQRDELLEASQKALQYLQDRGLANGQIGASLHNAISKATNHGN